MNRHKHITQPSCRIISITFGLAYIPLTQMKYKQVKATKGEYRERNRRIVIALKEHRYASFPIALLTSL